jgi:hypothetical protein
MRRTTIALALVLAVALALPAVAEVEEITVGGDIKIRSQIATPGWSYDDGELWFDDENANLDWTTQRTRLNVDASLSGGVRGYIELQAYDTWGWDDEDSEEAYDIGLWPDTEEFAGQGDPWVELYQAYIEMNDIADYPLRLRIGRQELVFGREWMVGNNDAGVNFSGLAFDALRLTYDTDMVAVDLWTSKLVDFSSPMALNWGGSVEQDADIDFHGLYATYKGIENLAIDGYFLWLRNANVRFWNFMWSGDTGEVQNLFTVGARVAGSMELAGGMFDYNAEGAMQFGDANLWVSSESGDFEGWAANLLAGFTLTGVDYTPRIEAEYAYFSGPGDIYNDNDMEMFMKLFSDVHYGALNLGQNLDCKATNLHIFKLGASAKPCEKSKVRADLYYFLLAEDGSDTGAGTFGVPQFAVPSSEYDDEVGMELDLAVDYQYTEDLLLTAGWAHFFADNAIENSWGGGVADDDVDYIYVDAQLTF